MNILNSVIRPFFFKTEEDRVIEAAKRGDIADFVNYFTHNEVPFKSDGVRRKMSPTGRVVYEDDIYDYVYIDGLWVNRFEFHVPQDVRSEMYEAMERAVMSNCHGTFWYEQRHFGQRTKTFDRVWEIPNHQIARAETSSRQIAHTSNQAKRINY